MAAVQRTFLTAYGNRLLEQWDRPLAQALAPIGKADAFEQLRAYLRLQAHVSRDFLRAPIEQILGSRLFTLSVERIGLRKHVHQERRNLFRPVPPLPLCPPPPFIPIILP